MYVLYIERFQVKIRSSGWFCWKPSHISTTTKWNMLLK